MELGFNTIQSLILRIDFINVLDEKTVIDKIFPILGNNFEMQEDFLRSVDINVPDLDQIENNIILKKSINSASVFRFTHKIGPTLNEKEQFNISRFFISYELTNPRNKYNLEEKIKRFIIIVGILKEQYSTMKIKRIGLRKINFILFDNLNSVYKTFNTKTFINRNDFAEKFSRLQTYENFSAEEIQFNLTKILASGTAQKQTIDPKSQEVTISPIPVIQATLDIDGYIMLTDSDPRNVDNNIILNINKNIFKIYKNCFNDDFFDNVKQKELDTIGILAGVKIYE